LPASSGRAGRPWCRFQRSLIGKGGLWVPYNLAKALAGRGLGAGVVPCPKRDRAVRKAALSSPGERPSAEDHRRTIAVESVAALDKVIPVDDMVTAGATLMGAAEKMRSAFPGVEVAAFAAMRTAGFQNIEKTRDPKVEAITGTQAARRSVDREGARPRAGSWCTAPRSGRQQGVWRFGRLSGPRSRMPLLLLLLLLLLPAPPEIASPLAFPRAMRRPRPPPGQAATPARARNAAAIPARGAHEG